MNKAGWLVLAIFGVVIAILASLVVIDTAKKQHLSATNTSNATSLNNCIDSIPSNNSEVTTLYAQLTADPLLTSNATSIASILASDYQQTQSCYTQYPNYRNNPQNASLQSACMNSDSNYSQYPNVFNQMASADPYIAAVLTPAALSIQSTIQEELSACKTEYPTN